ncbi:hypothetical protein TRFO_37770 [Tritrichomonas foetus]|uniref:USP domain-containing protein n=1 Tax=Tritrichomonas foetus TaxID=1144522 RepID=A0A1J4JEN2_9EUKA|nr:hypothetical protein TRFO_37770 [Tritrichomonas foetus]|eukprot:OHS96099.1 hypothetical protein TRFO_37770 [Tritrichomonas foetus]
MSSQKKGIASFIMRQLSLLLSHRQSVRTVAFKEILDKQIPLSNFLFIMSSKRPEITVDFLKSLKLHLNGKCSDNEICELCLLILSMLDDSHSYILKQLLKIIHWILMNGYFIEQIPILFLDCLINRFLKSLDEEDKIAFHIASKCMILLSIYKDNLLPELLQLHSNRVPFSRYNINGDEIVKLNDDVISHVGLKNLDSTCYLNSIIQLLYSILPLRNSVMSYSGDDHFMIQLSQLFVCMNLVKTNFLSPDELINNLKTWDDKPIDIRIQEDAQEFLQRIMDHLPNSDKKLFQGFMTTTITGINEKYSKSVNDPFFTLELDVLNLPDLVKSISQISEPVRCVGENKYYAESLNKKIDAIKTTEISLSPSILIIDLKRFQFNQLTQNRVKINKSFPVPLTFEIPRKQMSHDLNIDNKSNNDKSNIFQEIIPHYYLTGVIIHSGNADAGHYNAYCLYPEGWICFDDDNVYEVEEEEVISLAKGNLKGSGYILFYQHGTDLPFHDPTIQTDLIEKADKLNKEIELERVFCSSGYFKLISKLAKLPNSDYLPIIIRYIVDSLPFIRIKAIESVQKLFFNVFPKVKNLSVDEKCSFLNYTIPFLNGILVKSPSHWLRMHIVKLISLCFYENFDVKPLLSALSPIISTSLTNPGNMNPTFYLSYKIIKVYPFLKSKGSVQKVFLGFMNDELEIYLKENIQKTQSNDAKIAYSDINLTHFIKLALLFSENFHDLDKFRSNQLITYLLFTKTEIKSTALLSNHFYQPSEFMKYFESNIKQITIEKLLPLIAFSKNINQNFFKIVFDHKNDFIVSQNHRKAELIDILCVFCDMARRYKSIMQLFSLHQNDWISELLFSHIYNVRKTTLALYYFLILHEKLNKWTKNLEFPNDMRIPPIIEEIEHSEGEIQQISLSVIKNLLTNSQVLCQILIQDYKKNFYDDNLSQEYFILLYKLLRIVNHSEIDEFSFISKFYINISQNCAPFSLTLIRTAKMISEFGIPISKENLELGLTGIKQADPSNLLCFMQYFLDIYSRYSKMSENFINLFFSYFVFNPNFSHKNVNESYDQSFLYSYIQKNVPKNKIAIIEALNPNFKKWISINYYSMLLIIESLGIKRPLLHSLEELIDESYTPDLLNEIVKKTFYYADDEDFDPGFIKKLLVSKYISSNTKNRIRKYVSEISKSNNGSEFLKSSSSEDEDDSNADLMYDSSSNYDENEK